MTENVCPDATILAAFAEGTLGSEQRAEIERHVTTCPECPALIGEVIRFLAEGVDEGEGVSEDGKAETPHGRRWVIAAAVAAICIPAAVWRTTAWRDPMYGVRRIAAAAPGRGQEGRLHGFPHARFDAPRTGTGRLVSIPLQAEVERLAKRGRGAGVLHALGVTALLSGNPRQAVDYLNAAVRSAPNDAAIWNDLSVAELARFRLDDRAAVLRALKAANRALALAPTSPEAHFNRGLTLEHASRDADAAGAYRRALAHEPSEQWRREIRDRLQGLQDDP